MFLFFLLTFMFLINGDLSGVFLAKHSTHSVVVCKLISFHGLKSGEPEHLLYFYLSFYKAFMSDQLCVMPGFSFKRPHVVCSECMMKDTESGWLQ